MSRVMRIIRAPCQRYVLNWREKKKESKKVVTNTKPNVLKPRALVRIPAGSVGVGTTTTLLPVSALPDSRARNFHAKSAIVAPRSTGLPLCYPLSPHISYTRAELHGIRGRTKNNPAVLYSRAPSQLQLCALDLRPSPCSPPACLDPNCPALDTIFRLSSHLPLCTRIQHSSSPAFMWQCTHARLRRPDCSCLRTLPS